MPFKNLNSKVLNQIESFIIQGGNVLNQNPTDLLLFFKYAKQNQHIDGFKLCGLKLKNQQLYFDNRHAKHALNTEELLKHFATIYQIINIYKQNYKDLNQYETAYHDVINNHQANAFNALSKVKSIKPLYLLRVNVELAKSKQRIKHTHGKTNHEIIRQDIDMLSQLPQNGLIQLILGRYSDRLVSKQDLKCKLRNVLKLAKKIEFQSNQLTQKEVK